jgi:hypothetical protein
MAARHCNHFKWFKLAILTVQLKLHMTPDNPIFDSLLEIQDIIFNVNKEKQHNSFHS